MAIVDAHTVEQLDEKWAAASLRLVAAIVTEAREHPLPADVVEILDGINYLAVDALFSHGWVP